MFRTLSILILGAFLGAALLTPLVYEGLLWISPQLDWPFSRVFSRVATLLALLLMISLKNEFNFAQLKEYLGSHKSSSKRIFGPILLGIVLSFGISALIFPVVLSYGKITWAGLETSYLLKKFIYVIPAALLIGFLEESFFRVLLFDRFKQSFSARNAAIGVSALYAVLHFIAPVRDFKYENYSALIGFDYLSQIVSRMLMPEILPAMLGLFLVGLTLAYTIHKSGSLYLAIGLHAGWVMAVKLSSTATTLAPGVEFAPGVGRRYYMVSTPLSWVSILLVWGLCVVVCRRFFPAESRA